MCMIRAKNEVFLSEIKNGMEWIDKIRFPIRIGIYSRFDCLNLSLLAYRHIFVICQSFRNNAYINVIYIKFLLFLNLLVLYIQ